MNIVPENKAKWLRLASVALTVVLLGTAASFIWTAASGLLGLGVIGAMVVVYGAAIKALPLLARKWERKLLQLEKKEAEDNPIEQFEMDALRNQGILDGQLHFLEEKASSIRGMHDMLVQQKKDDPEIDLTQQWTDYTAMTVDLEEEKSLYAQALADQKDFEKYIEQQKFYHKFGTAAEKARGLSNPAEAAKARLFNTAAQEAIREKYNRSFAAMEMRRLQSNPVKKPTSALTNNPSQTLDVVDVTARQLTSVKKEV
jgi:hypothetical protein